MKRVYCILPCLMLLGLLALAGCMTLPGSGQSAAVQAQPATGPELARLDAGAAWLDASVAKIMAAVKASTAQAPDVDTAALEPAVTALQTLVASYGSAVALDDVPKATATWPQAREAVTTAIEVAGKVLPGLTALLGG
ncbi:hypothetical protein [Solidesulfovibrio sp.]